MSDKKYSGVLLPISSLPGKYGIGQIGKSAYNFIDFLAACKFTYWEILPLCPTNITNSPYQGTSAFGFNIYYVDFDLLVEDGLLNSRDFQGVDFGKNPREIDYKKVFQNSRQLLYKAYKRFDKNNENFIRFCTEKNYQEVALYMALKELNNYKAWYDWRLEDRFYEPEVGEELMKYHSDLFYFYMFTQFKFCSQWQKLKDYAHSKGIKICGQIAHFIGYDSDQVYFHPEEFLLDKLGRMTLVAGFPPDEFTKDGQKWGEPLYDWQYMKQNHYKWWTSRLHHAFSFYDEVMINHFSGFYKVYGVPFRDINAKNGHYIYASGSEVIENFKDSLIVASDLGNLDAEVKKFINKTNFIHPVASCLPLFKKRKYYDKYLPSAVEENTLLYIGNHDNMPLRGRLENINREDRAILGTKIISECDKLGIDKSFNLDSNREVFNKIIEIVGKSNARCVSFVMQDILYQGAESRLNYPGKTDTRLNWRYRYLQSDITKIIQDKRLEVNINIKRAF